MKKMIKKIEIYYKKMGINELMLDAYHSNILGLNSWKNIGFAPVKITLNKKIL